MKEKNPLRQPRATQISTPNALITTSGAVIGVDLVVPILVGHSKEKRSGGAKRYEDSIKFEAVSPSLQFLKSLEILIIINKQERGAGGKLMSSFREQNRCFVAAPACSSSSLLLQLIFPFLWGSLSVGNLPSRNFPLLPLPLSPPPPPRPERTANCGSGW